jgi:hypothetical protein
MSEAVVVIPVYKSIPSESEERSFRQCIKVLQQYPIRLVAPKDLDLSFYQRLHPPLQIEEFEPKYFKSTLTYNHLLLSRHFYRRFDAFKFMLIHQLDAYVFRDELAVWCQKDYDFIGAPVHQFRLDNFNDIIPIATLNGGFSLRKINSAIRVLNSFRLIHPLKSILHANIETSGNIMGTLKGFYFYFFGNNTFEGLNKYDRNEDYFWAIISKRLFSWYSVAPVTEALYFSFDNSPEKSFEMANDKVPFGCHEFHKHLPFWEKYLSI